MPLTESQRDQIKQIKQRYEQAERDRAWYENFMLKREQEQLFLINKLRSLQLSLGWPNDRVADEVMMDRANFRALLARRQKIGPKREARILQAIDKMERLLQEQDQ